ncbi:MAG: ribonuclease P protein component [Usitatibacter sp.]
MPRGPRTEGYPRRHRFTAQGSFGPLLRGSRKLRGRYATVHAAPGRPGVSRLGIALTRKLVPRSVDRNRVKRLVRETFRHHFLKRAGVDCVVMLRERFAPAHLGALRDEIRGHFDQLVPVLP